MTDNAQPGNYADARAKALEDMADTLVMERTSYGWQFFGGWEQQSLGIAFAMWYDGGEPRTTEVVA